MRELEKSQADHADNMDRIFPIGTDDANTFTQSYLTCVTPSVMSVDVRSCQPSLLFSWLLTGAGVASF